MTMAELDPEIDHWQMEHIRAAIREAEEGNLIPHEQVRRIAEDWRLLQPRPKKSCG